LFVGLSVVSGGFRASNGWIGIGFAKAQAQAEASSSSSTSSSSSSSFQKSSSSSSSEVILLAPPASDYDYYDGMRSHIFDFTAQWYLKAVKNNDLVIIAAHNSKRESITEADDGAYVEMKKRGVPTSALLHAKLFDIWARDFLMTDLGRNRTAKFRYDPTYINIMEARYIRNSADIAAREWSLPGLLTFDNLVLDGGGIAVDADGKRAVVTERVLKDNPWLIGREGQDGYARGPANPNEGQVSIPYPNIEINAADLQLGASALERKLGLERVAIIPEERLAPRLGHVDGLVGWLAPGVLALSNFSSPSDWTLYESTLRSRFGDAVKIVAFPYEPTEDVWKKDGFESAAGIYVNFVRTKNAVYVPTFAAAGGGGGGDAKDSRFIASDELALRVAEQHAGVPAVAIDASEVSIMGGSVRCLSMHLSGVDAAHMLQLANDTSRTQRPTAYQQDGVHGKTWSSSASSKKAHLPILIILGTIATTIAAAPAASSKP